ncbi:stage II sporulation protein E [Salipaludibacillus sp. LMS25]|jgi:stage II sporulation protein E|uniref:stage II sporulation protein E n=1 Tax=Salipaludibacillus sp. LMS25 TaxID=2924031 RepID=UPI0020D0BDFA|nr:stage II sporulation protein E [Salipaludibacillus sp. LMS25]UTR16664.1 stage II sporulation protein E [Salipaludibacillus sp. LMS25]
MFERSGAQIMTKMNGQAVSMVEGVKGFVIRKALSLTERKVDKVKIHALKRLLITMGVGFLLGRSVILLQLLPFAIPFLAVVFKWKRNLTLPAAFALIAGSTSLSFGYAGHTTVAILLYFLLQGVIEKVDKKRNFLPLTVFLAVAGTRYLSLIIQEGPSWYHLFTASVEGGLALIVTLIFFQSVPLFFERKKQLNLKHEEVVCLVILLGSLLTGTVGWLIFHMSVEHIVARYMVLIFAFSGGATIGATVGVIMGLILSLASVSHLVSMSLLAFAGLLGGLLKEGGKVGAALGLIIASLLMAMYADSQSPLNVTLFESLTAATFFFLTPKKWTSSLAGYIPGTVEYTQEQQKYLRKIRDVTAGKVEQFSDLFLSLSRTFSFHGRTEEEKEKECEVDLFLSSVTEATCQTCMKKQQCWAREFDKTYGLMEQVMGACEKDGDIKERALAAVWKKHCIIDTKVVDTINAKLKERDGEMRLRHQLLESRQLVAEQLIGVSQVMEDFAKDIQREKKVHEQQEIDIKNCLAEAGVDVDLVDIYSLEPGNVDVEMIIPSNTYNEAEKVIAPLLSDILRECVVVKQTEATRATGPETKVVFASTKTFVINQGVAHTAKGGKWVSGDSYSTMEIGEGTYAMAISDGMGNGRRAHIESQETIDLLRRILLSGIDETVAIKSINSVLSLRSNEEVFSTLDLAMLDLQTGKAKFLKVGSTPSYIKRGEQVISLEAGNLPIGMIREMDVDVVSEQLKAGDLLIMMSDGVYEASNYVENRDIRMKRMIREMMTQDPQEVADLLMEKMIRDADGEIHDDMTVLVAKVDHYLPEWATFSPLEKERA